MAISRTTLGPLVSARQKLEFQVDGCRRWVIDILVEHASRRAWFQSMAFRTGTAHAVEVRALDVIQANVKLD